MARIGQQTRVKSGRGNVKGVPATPTLTATASGQTQVNLTWSPPSGVVYQSFASYQLDRSTDQSSWTTIYSGAATSYADTGRTAGTTYYYRLRTYDGVTYGAYATANATTTTSEVAAPANWFVQDNGSDTTGTGSAAQPFATLGRAVSVASSGDIIELRKSGGGTWTITSGFPIVLSRAFSTSNPVMIRVRAGDTVRLWPASSVTRVLQTTGQGYVLDGTGGVFEIGNQALWSPTGGGTSSHANTNGIGPGSSTNTMSGFTFRNVKLTGATTGWGALHFEKVPGLVHLDGVDAYGHGTCPGGRDGLFHVGSGPLKVENSKFKYFGGHGYLGISANAAPFAVRNNELDGRWSDVVPNESYRVAEFAPSQAYPNGGVPASTQPSIIENNLIYGVSGSASNAAQPDRISTYKLNGRRMIFRFNYVLRCKTDNHESVNGYLSNTDGCLMHMRIYHNTYHDCNNMWADDGRTKQVGVTNLMGDIRRINNLYSDVTSTAWPGFGTTLRTVDRRSCGQYEIGQSYPDAWLGATVDGCMISMKSNGPMRIALVDGTAAGVATSLAQAQSLWPNVWLPSTSMAAPVFVNPSLNTRAGFELSLGSPGRGQAVPMATVLSSSTGTVVSLSDAFWIYDGTWLPGDVGDYIAFYNSTGATLKGIRQVASVNSATSATLTQPISVSSGDRVYLVLADGQTVCRNVGASQA